MSSTKAGKRPLRSLTAHEKLNAIQRVSVGGESKASVARDIGVPESTLRGWCKNQEKISYQVKTSPSQTNVLSENCNQFHPKKIKMDNQPYNLSMKTSETSNGSFSPNSEKNYDSEYFKCSENDSENSPLNLRIKLEVNSSLLTTPRTTNSNFSTSEKEKEREKNRAELAKLSEQLGLNRPEVFLSTLNNSNNMSDITTLLVQWNTIYQQHLLYQQQKAVQQQNKTNAVTSADSANISSPSGLLTTVEKRDKVPSTSQQPTYDSLTYWLRQQSLLGLSTTTQPLMAGTSACTTSGSTNQAPVNNGVVLPTIINDTTLNKTSNSHLRFWNWYKQSAYNPSDITAIRHSFQNPEKSIEQQQLTQEFSESDLQNAENESLKDDKPKSFNKNRAVLDNLLINNNSIEYYPSHKEDNQSSEAYEAIEHGEKFLKWLESCSDPSVTTVQILSLQSLIKNLKTGFNRKNSNSHNNKTKVKRK